MNKLELVFFLRRKPTAQVADFMSQCSRYVTRITASGDGPRPEGLPGFVHWVSLAEGDSRAGILNRIYAQSPSDYLLYLEDGEFFNPDHLPNLAVLGDEAMFPVRLVTMTRSGESETFYQLRLLPIMKTEFGEEIFDGWNIPDATRFVYRRKLELRDFVLDIRRTAPMFASADADQELAAVRPSAQAFLLLGRTYFDEGKYVAALAAYRNLLKRPNVLPFDRLAAINGMASCMAEQHKWDQALELVRQSLEAEPQQYLPYLIKFRVYQLRKLWAEAILALREYRAHADLPTRAGFDVQLGREIMLHQQADLAFKAGRREEAFAHYEEIFQSRKGDVSQEQLKLLFVFAIELEHPEKALLYYHTMFGNLDGAIPEEHLLPEMLEWLSMLMAKGWYDFPTSVYEQLFTLDPANPLFRRHLVAGYTKTNQLDQARRLIQGRR